MTMSPGIVSGCLRMKTSRIASVLYARSFRNICGLGKCENCELLRRNASPVQLQATYLSVRCRSTQAKILPETNKQSTQQHQRNLRDQQKSPVKDSRQSQFQDLMTTFHKLQKIKGGLTTKDGKTAKDAAVAKRSSDRPSQRHHPARSSEARRASPSKTEEYIHNDKWKENLQSFSSQMNAARTKMKKAGKKHKKAPIETILAELEARETNSAESQEADSVLPESVPVKNNQRICDLEVFSSLDAPEKLNASDNSSVSFIPQKETDSKVISSFSKEEFPEVESRGSFSICDEKSHGLSSAEIAAEDKRRPDSSPKASSSHEASEEPQQRAKDRFNLKWRPGSSHNQTLEEMKETSAAVVKILSSGVNLEPISQEKSLLLIQERRSFVKACVSVGMMKEANSLLTVSYHRGKRTRLEQISDLLAINIVFHGWARLGQLQPIQKLFQLMDKHGVQPNFQSYAALLECAARQKDFQHDIAEKAITDLREAGFNLEDIGTECQFRPDQWQHVLKAIKTIVPDFQPRIPSLTEEPDVTDRYTSELVERLKNSTPQQSANPAHNIFSPETFTKKLEEQLQIELKDYVSVSTVETEPELTKQCQFAREKLEECQNEWRNTLLKSFSQSKLYLELEMKGDYGTSILPYLKLFDQDYYVNLMLHEIELLGQKMELISPTVATLQSMLGSKVRQSHMVQEKLQDGKVAKTTKLFKEYFEVFNAERLDKNHREIWQDILSRNYDGLSLESDDSTTWPYHIARKVGRFLYNIILADVRIDANLFKNTNEKCIIPAFYTVFRATGDRFLQKEIKPHPVLVKLYEEAKIRKLTFDPSELPSVVPPLPWTTHKAGGNLLSTIDLIRHAHINEAQMSLLKNLPPSQLHPMLDALNGLSSTPWVINKPVLDTVTQLFNKGGDAHLDIPPPASSCPEGPKALPDMTIAEKQAVIAERRELQKKKMEMHSIWCTELLRLSIANKYRDEIFWFPHNMDFRGRVYAVPPHFSHLGSDLARSILKFAKGKPLGPHGLDWLKIHLVNLTGMKKRSANHQRLQFANEHMDDILDSADNILTGRKWWQESDEPWQTLACCIEITNAVRSENQEQFVSQFPVHQDGSCNGLQHYAALGRDRSGAESVNLVPFDTPNDVYSDVVELVRRECAKDAAEGNEVAQNLGRFITRKVIKQTIMTTVYGVTDYGARRQIQGQLEDILEFPQSEKTLSAYYLSKKTFQCLQEMFTATKQIQDWFVISAGLVTKVANKPISWVTPLGWPVIQPYTKIVVHNEPLPEPDQEKEGGSAKARLKRNRKTQLRFRKPNAKKHMNAFPPNFIHSLDSAHMMLTSIYCLRAGVTFVSVHDCFWTHASDVAAMNKICREQFVALHSHPILEELSEYMLKHYGFSESDDEASRQVHLAKAYVNFLLGKVPERGTFDLQTVLDSTYFFS